MKKYLLDTNICIFFLQGKYGIVDKIKEVGQKNCLISEITVAELYFGAYHSNNKDKHLKETKDFISQFTIQLGRKEGRTINYWEIMNFQESESFQGSGGCFTGNRFLLESFCQCNRSD